jgi:hypothetical protein
MKSASAICRSVVVVSREVVRRPGVYRNAVAASLEVELRLVI